MRGSAGGGGGVGGGWVCEGCVCVDGSSRIKHVWGRQGAYRVWGCRLWGSGFKVFGVHGALWSLGQGFEFWGEIWGLSV